MEKLRSFNYENVKLLDSWFDKQRQETMETYLQIPDERLLFGFRKKAGRLAPGYPLTGWYADGAPSFGQILGALAKFYAQTKDEKILAKLTYLIDEWGKTISPDGFGGFPFGSDSLYRYEKVLGGLLDAYEYAGNDKALEYAGIFTDYVAETVFREFPRDGLISQLMCEHDVIEWYTIPENLYRLYGHTGKENHYDLAKEMDYPIFWEHIKNPAENPFGPRHAYSHINCLSGAMRAYMTDDNEEYLNIAKKGYELFYNEHTYVTGGYGPCEMLMGPEGYLGDFLKNFYDPTRNPEIEENHFCPRVTAHDNCEVPCCSWAVFKLGNYLTRYLGDVSYSQWTEKLLVNGMAGELPVTAGGEVMYYANYPMSGAFKTVKDNRMYDGRLNFNWQCCTGTYPQSVAEYVNMIYYLDDNDDIYINQYIPSIVKWHKQNKPLELTMESNYPLSGAIKISIKTTQRQLFSVYVRIPEWSKGKIRLKINGLEDNNYFISEKRIIVSREWESTDFLEIIFPMTLSFASVDAKSPDLRALCYGPVVLAGDEMAVLKGDCEHPEQWIDLIDKENLIFETKPGHDMGYDFLTRKFRPYYLIEEMKWYYLYNIVYNDAN